MAYRNEHGPFKSVDDLALVKNMPRKVIESNRELLKLEGGGGGKTRRAARRRTLAQYRPNPAVKARLELRSMSPLLAARRLRASWISHRTSIAGRLRARSKSQPSQVCELLVMRPYAGRFTLAPARQTGSPRRAR